MRIFQRVCRPDGRRDLFLFSHCIVSYRKKRRDCDVCGVENQIIGLPAHARLFLYGNRNRVIFEGGAGRFKGTLRIGSREHPISDCVIHVGLGSTSNGCKIILMENGTSVTIGRDCMISWNVEILASDTHAILQKGRVTNHGRRIDIGDHVWLGAGAFILKNTRLSNDTIVGCGAVVTGLDVKDAGSLVVGNPAKVIRTGMTWDRRTPDELKEIRAS